MAFSRILQWDSSKELHTHHRTESNKKYTDGKCSIIINHHLINPSSSVGTLSESPLLAPPKRAARSWDVVKENPLPSLLAFPGIHSAAASCRKKLSLPSPPRPSTDC